MTNLPTRRTLLKYGTAAAASAAFGNLAFSQSKTSSPQRVVVIMFDGFDPRYLAASNMPVLGQWKRDGMYKQVKGVMPSVTNANNASICCGAWPETHGINANSYFDEKSGEELYVESADLVLAPTLFERAARQGVKSALLSSKAKTATLLMRAGAAIVLTAEHPGPESGPAARPRAGNLQPGDQLRLMAAAINILKTRPDIGVLYVHTTDYPMHMWAPSARIERTSGAPRRSLRASYEGEPDAAFLATADHGMNAKSLCWDLEQVCAVKESRSEKPSPPDATAT